MTAGYRCVVLEGRPIIGGGTQTTSLTLSGFKEDVCSTVHALIQANPMFRDHEIDLRPYGLEYLKADPIVFMPFLDGTSIAMWQDVERTAAEFAKFSKKDADTYRRLFLPHVRHHHLQRRRHHFRPALQHRVGPR